MGYAPLKIGDEVIEIQKACRDNSARVVRQGKMTAISECGTFCEITVGYWCPEIHWALMENIQPVQRNHANCDCVS